MRTTVACLVMTLAVAVRLANQGAVATTLDAAEQMDALDRLIEAAQSEQQTTTQAGEAIEAQVNALLDEEVSALREIIASSVDEVHTAYKAKHGAEAKNFFSRLFNCYKCRLDDGTTGILDKEKKQQKDIDDSASVDLHHEGADFMISRLFALEWAIAPAPNPFPNPMVSYACEPQGNFFETALPGGSPEAEQARRETQVEQAEQELASGSTNAVADEAISTGERSGEVTAESENHGGMIMRVMHKIWAKVKAYGSALMKKLGALWTIVRVVLRCAVCVVCNVLNMLIEFVKYLGKRLHQLSGKVMHLASNMASGMRKVFTKPTPAADNSLGVGDKCTKNAECITRACVRHTTLQRSKMCAGNAEHPETDHSVCAHYHSAAKCAERGCHWNPTVKHYVRRNGACQITSEVETSPTNLLEVNSKMVATRRLHHVAKHLADVGALEDPETFAHETLLSKDSFMHMLSGVTSFLQTSALAGAESTSAVVRSHLASKGIVALPNVCVNNEALGKTIGIAINYENPSLLEALAAPPFSFANAVPELLVAIYPITAEDGTIDDRCLAGRVYCEKSQTPHGVARNCNHEARSDLDEQFVQSAETSIDSQIDRMAENGQTTDGGPESRVLLQAN